jgi:hypothetical protein
MTAHGGVKRDSARIKFCQELGISVLSGTEVGGGCSSDEAANYRGAKDLYIERAE